jgi:hypothetical protein
VTDENVTKLSGLVSLLGAYDAISSPWVLSML